jgi:MoxR-like ATPase
MISEPDIGSKLIEYNRNNAVKIQLRRDQITGFTSRFPFRTQPSLIDDLKPSDIYEKGSKNSFFYWIEFGVPSPHLTVRGAGNFAIAKARLSDFKSLLKIVSNDQLSIHEKIDAAWDKLRGFGKDKHIAKKILMLFYPEKIFPILSTKHLEYFANKLGLDVNTETRRILNKDYENASIGEKFEIYNRLFDAWKETHAPTSDNIALMEVLYDMFPPPGWRAIKSGSLVGSGNSKQLFITPASGAKAQTNFSSTMRKPITFDSISTYVQNRTLADQLRSNGSFGVWGLTPGGGQLGGIKKLRQDDIVAFYMSDEIGFIGNAIGWEKNQKLAEHLWPDGKTYELVFFLQNVTEVNVPYEKYKRETGYKGPPQKFQIVKPPNKNTVEQVIEALFGQVAKENRVWIFQARPTHYNVREATKRLPEIAWSVAQHIGQIKLGDRVYLWESGSRGGIVAVCTVADNPSIRPEPENEFQFFITSPEFPEDKLRVRLRIDHVLDPIVSRAQIISRPELKDLSILRMAQGTNFPVTAEEAEILDQLIRINAESFLLLKSQTDSDWPDKEGEEYHYGTNVTNETKLVPGAKVLFERNLNGENTFIGHGKVISVQEAGSGISKSGNPFVKKIAYLDKENYVKYKQPRKRTAEAEALLKSLDTYNPQNSIVTLTKQVFDQITGASVALTLDQLETETFLDREFLITLERILLTRKQVILYGPPGTGKTFVAKKFAQYLVGNNGKFELIQFHPSYSYEDFIEGIKPRLEEKQVNFVMENGILKELANEAAANPGKRYVMIIDEINRGNITKILGELIYCLEYRDSTIRLPYSKEMFRLPANLYLIGTMNSADRSIALVDYALRRRFVFQELMPSPEILAKWLTENPSSIPTEKLVQFMRDLNSKINEDEKLGRHFQIGHSYFMEKNIDITRIREIWRFKLLPLLEEYYFQEPRELDKYTKMFQEVFP